MKHIPLIIMLINTNKIFFLKEQRIHSCIPKSLIQEKTNKTSYLNIANEKQPYLFLGDLGLGSIGLANKYYYKSM